MCVTCGCSSDENEVKIIKVDGKTVQHSHSHDHGNGPHEHSHSHDHNHEHHHHDHDHNHIKEIDLEKDLANSLPAASLPAQHSAW